MSAVSGARPVAPIEWLAGFVAAAAIVKLLLAFFVGFGDDEAYTLVISRRLALSYFDHPPLHQWLLRGFAQAFGEGHYDRLPFYALHVATNVPLYAMALRLSGRDAALWTIFAFNATAYFLLLPDGFIMPDEPLLFSLACAGWALVELVADESVTSGRATALWFAAGLAFGLAGLSKYTAALVPVGLAGFLVCSPTHRKWLLDPRPYLAAILALAIFSPAILWNAQNGWVSFAFQSHRAPIGAGVTVFALRAFAEETGSQIASLLPPVFIAASMGMFVAARRNRADDGARLLLWLAAPTLVLFFALPFTGKRAIPHWFNSGWLFVFPLAGIWLAGLTASAQRRFATVSAGLATLVLALYIPLIVFGAAPFLPARFDKMKDPTASDFDWPSVASQPLWTAGGRAPGFILVDNWRIGGRIGTAVGPQTPVCGFRTDPRGLAFSCDPDAFVGQDALIVAPDDGAEDTFGAAAPYFESLGAPQTFKVGRAGRNERTLLVVRATHLKAPFPRPYGL